MTRKLETGEFLADRDTAAAPANHLRPVDYEAEKRADRNKRAAFKKH